MSLYTMGTCVYRSTDGGHTLVAFKGAPGGDDPNQWWIDPSDPSHIVYGGDQGAAVSLDGGLSWSTWYNQKTAEIYKIDTDNRYPYWIYGSKQDSGTFGIASRGPVGKITDLDWFPLPGWESGFVTVDPAHPDVIFTNGPWGFLQKVNRRTWGAQSVDFGVGTISAVKDTDFRRAVSAPIVFSPQNASVSCITAPKMSGRARMAVSIGTRSVRISPPIQGSRHCPIRKGRIMETHWFRCRHHPCAPGSYGRAAITA